LVGWFLVKRRERKKKDAIIRHFADKITFLAEFQSTLGIPIPSDVARLTCSPGKEPRRG
jgi:hypothetical protein